jgi:hypothetical protein
LVISAAPGKAFLLCTTRDPENNPETYSGQVTSSSRIKRAVTASAVVARLTNKKFLH